MNIRKINMFDIINKKFLETYKRVNKIDVKYPISELQDYYRKEPFTDIYVYEEDGIIVGTVTLKIDIRLERKFARIEDVAVRKENEGKGIATKLIKHILNVIKNQNYYKVIVTCSENMESFYKRLGFKQNGIVMRFETSD